MFEDYRKIFVFGRDWNFDEYSGKKLTIREIRRDMHKQREWRNDLEKMKISQVCLGAGKINQCLRVPVFYERVHNKVLESFQAGQ